MNGGGSVLVVDDDDDVRDAIVFILRRTGRRILEATQGAEALALIQGGEVPDLILLDMNMPVMDGWTFARELKACGAATMPIVVITAAHDAQRSADEIGAADFVGKPFELEALVRVVERHLDGRGR